MLIRPSVESTRQAVIHRNDGLRTIAVRSARGAGSVGSGAGASTGARAAPSGRSPRSAGQRRRTSPWIGRPTTPATTVSTTSASRQPSRSTSRPVSGTKTRLAAPPKTVNTSTAWARRAVNQLAVTENAGSYSVAAMASPASANSATKPASDSTRDHASRTPTVSRLPAVISARAPCRCSQRPTGTAATPEATMPTAYAALSSPNDHPSSARIGTTKTENA